MSPQPSWAFLALSLLGSLPSYIVFQTYRCLRFCCKDSICIFILLLLAAFDWFSRGQKGKCHLYTSILKRNLSVNPKYTSKHRHRVTGRGLTHEHLSAGQAGSAQPGLLWEMGAGGFSPLELMLRKQPRAQQLCWDQAQLLKALKNTVMRSLHSQGKWPMAK